MTSSSIPTRPNQTQYSPYVAEIDPARPRVLLLTGLPGSGKTTVAQRLVKDLSYFTTSKQVVHLNADFVRSTLNKHLSFSKGDRLKQAYSMGVLSQIVANSGAYVVVEFVCPNFDTRAEYLSGLGPTHIDNLLWVELSRPSNGEVYADTSRMYTPVLDDFFDMLGVPPNQFLHIVNDKSASEASLSIIDEAGV